MRLIVGLTLFGFIIFGLIRDPSTASSMPGTVSVSMDDRIFIPEVSLNLSLSDSSFSPVHQSVLIERLPVKQRKHIEKEILSLLGLEHTPRPDTRTASANAPASKYMMTLYRSLLLQTGTGGRSKDEHRRLDGNFEMTGERGLMKQLNTADTIMSFINQAHANKYTDNDHSIDFEFDLSQVSSSDVLLKAVLRLYTYGRPLPTQPSTHHALRLEVLATMQQFYGKPVYQLESSKVINLEWKGWMDINITHVAEEWKKFPNRNRGLILRVLDSEGNKVDPSTVGLVGRLGPDDKQAFMVAFFKSAHKSGKVTTTTKKKKVPTATLR